jgi:lipopolysaccharide export system protein LptA
MVYNYEKEEGIIEKNVYVYDKENNMELLGDRGEFKRDKYFNIYDNIKMNYGNYTATTDVIYYKIDESRVDFPNKTLVDSSIKDVKGRVEKGWYDTEASIFYGDDYVGSSGLSRSKSNYINYYLNEDKAELEGNVEVEDRDTGVLIETEKLTYYRATDYAIAPQEVKITRENIVLDASEGNADLVRKTIELKDGVLTTTLGDKIVGDRLFGNYLKNQFDFEGNIKGKIYTMNEEQFRSEEAIDYNNPLKFTGELANMYFVEALPGEYITTRAEIRNDSTFIYKNMELKGDYIEAQGSTQKVFARGNSIISLENSNQIRADSIILNLITENAEMNSNVIISGVSEDTGGINVKADKANFNNNTSKVDLEGNIESYKGETKFNADSGVYDLVEASLAGKGNIFVTLDFETYEEAEAKRKKDKQDKQKIEEAKTSVKIPKSIEPSIYKIEMPTQYKEVSIEWLTSNENYIDTEGNVYHPYRDGVDIYVKLTAKYILDKKIEEKNYYIRVEKEDKYSYLKRLVNNKEFIYNRDGNLLEYETKNEYKLKFVQRDNSFVDSEGKLLSNKIEEIKDKKFAVEYYFEDIKLELFYKFVEKNGEITVEKVKEEGESVEEHSSTGLRKDI